jgi:hypothetical protein
MALGCALLVGSTGQMTAKPNVGEPTGGGQQPGLHKRLSAGCDPASAAVDLDINNVRARIMNGGDMWWDLVSTARYEIPKVTGANEVHRTSLFAGALWIGGLQNNNLKLAAMTYRQTGNDFFPGPLDTVSASVDPSVCKQYDKIWEVTRDDIDKHTQDVTAVTDDIRSWPAMGNTAQGQAKYLAPFVDVNHDFVYNEADGDYPDVFGDQTLWWIYNDKGNIHTESKADAIGLELQTQAFAYTTNDEINNMTFYTTTITNRSKNRLDSTYFGEWVDADLGYAFDDYVGCDTTRSLGICYNGDNFDEGVTGYGANPPSVGVDFFQGPKDANGKEIGMSYFVYYNNDFSVMGNPENAINYYYYLTGRWKNGDWITYGGNGHGGGKRAKYMFPGDPTNTADWSEVTAGNKPGDRRFLQSSGAFSLRPGAKNKVTVGVVWARATTGGATGSLVQLKLADDKAQRLYNNNFKLIDGPTAPDMVVREMNNQVVLTLENTYNKNTEQYQDTVISATGQKVVYKFEGYEIYQLSSSTVTSSEIGNPDKARLVAQVDVKNGITKLVNRQYDPEVGADQLIMEVNGQDSGIRHTFKVTTDQFASGSAQLVNYKFYYYTIVAYARALDPTEPTQYLAGRKNNQVYTAIPHPNNSEFGGTTLNSDYGSGPQLTRQAGTGNGGNSLELTPASIDEILKNGYTNTPTYVGGQGPVKVTVYDPTQVVPGHYMIKLLDKGAKDTLRGATTSWFITNLDTHDTIHSDTFLNYSNEQVLYKKIKVNGETQNNSWGMAVSIQQPLGPGYPNVDAKNGFISASMAFDDPSNQWLGGVYDIEQNTSASTNLSGSDDGAATPGNWIRAGKFGTLTAYKATADDAAISTGTAGYDWVDPAQVYEGLLSGSIAPAALVARSNTDNFLTMGPIPDYLTAYISPKLNNLASIDLVFTSDKTKWSRCFVWETGESAGLNQGGASKFDLRKHQGWNGDVDASGNPVYSTNPNDSGMSYFPGYAINLETGDRLNVFFGEDSHLPGENGADMIWNPTGNLYSSASGYTDYLTTYLWGGKHWIYVMNSVGGTGNLATRYDQCAYLTTVMRKPAISSRTERTKAFSSMIYVMEPALNYYSKLLPLSQGLIPNDVHIRIRISKPYALWSANGGDAQPTYTFSTDDIAATHTQDAGKTALQNVNIVPNPYYAVSEYETSQLDNRVRITNVPTKCQISIYTLDGTLVRTFNRDESAASSPEGRTAYPATYVDWDLKNEKGIPVASGVYLIHVNGYGLGERVIKWFGVMKPLDLDTF